VLFGVLCPLLDETRIYLSDASNQRENKRFSGKTTVIQQYALRWNWSYMNPSGFRDQNNIRIPYDTFFQLLWFRPHVVISSELGLRTFFSVLYRVAFPKIVLILWATLSDRTEYSRGKLRKLLRRWILARVDASFVNGQSGERYLRGMGFKGAIFTVPYVVNEKAFQSGKQAPEDGAPYLFCACQLIERKGLHRFLAILIRWCSDHPSQRVVLRIAGDGPELKRLFALPYPPTLLVIFLGKVPYEHMASLYQAASLFVFPTLADEWGLVVAEALSCSVPVLGSLYSQAVEELVVDGHNGWTFIPTNEQSTYEAIDRALNTGDEDRKVMAQNAHASVARITPEVVATTIVEAIHTVMNSKGA
jgi:hypothetical protein